MNALGEIGENESMEEAIIDLITDLMHLADIEGLDGGDCHRIAGMHHFAESEA